MSDFDLVSFDPKKAQPIRWVWSKRIVRGGMNLLVGNEGVGKGILVSWMLARLSVGKLGGCYDGAPTKSAIIANEDDLNDVWFPRVLASGGDVRQIVGIRRDDFGLIDFTTDLEDLLKKIRRAGIKFVYFDQLQDHLGGQTDANNSKQVRNALVPVHSSLREHQLTGLATLHPNKRGESFRDLVNGSGAVLAIVRGAMYVAHDPDDPSYRVLITRKSNYAEMPSPLEFRIVADSVRPNGRNLPTARLIDLRTSTKTFEELVARRPKATTKASRLEVVLRTVLSDGEWHFYRDLLRDERVVSLSPNRKIMDRTAARLGIEKRRGKFQGQVEWRLSESR